MHSGKFIRLLPLIALTACAAAADNATLAPKAPDSTAGETAASTIQVGGQALCLDTMYNGMTAGSGVQVWTCDGMSNQAWTYANNRVQIFGNLCLQAGTSPLQVQPCDANNPAQAFTFNGNALVNQGQCLSVATLATDTPTTMAPCTPNTPTQTWRVPTANAPVGGNPNAAAPSGNTRTIEVINNCSQTVYAGAFVQGGDAPNNGGWEMPANTNTTVTVQAPWSGRIWARTGCTFDASGKGSCQTGDCAGQLQCGHITSQPASLAEFTFGGWAGQDFYDVSLVDGFNVPISAGPAAGAPQGGDPYRCGTPSCAPDLNAACPAALQHPVGGQNVACYNACQAIGGDQYCCSGAYNTRDACVPNGFSSFFKQACPQAYSYPDDDVTSTFTCTAASYVVTFCPKP